MVTLKEVDVRSTELAYVTAINPEEKSFFVQQCKYTNHELVTHNEQIHDYCKQISSNKIKGRDPIQPVVGEVLCARYKLDSNWYRMIVTGCNNEFRECTGYFIDYGNVEIVSYDDLLRADPIKVPTIEHAPFGFFAKMREIEDADQDRAKYLLESLMNEYIMVRQQGQLRENLWNIELPNVAYNTTFWIAYERKFT